MSRPRESKISLKESLERLRSTGIRGETLGIRREVETLDPLRDRIRSALNILSPSDFKPGDMNYLIMYDISDDKVRYHVAKYLKKNGCVRIQRSVFLARSDHKRFDSILETLKEINEYYENEDSIILVPVNVSDVRSMKVVGKDLQVDHLTDPPGTLFF